MWLQFPCAVYFSSEKLDTYFITPFCWSFQLTANKDNFLFFFTKNVWCRSSIYDGLSFENTPMVQSAGHDFCCTHLKLDT